MDSFLNKESPNKDINTSFTSNISNTSNTEDIININNNTDSEDNNSNTNTQLSNTTSNIELPTRNYSTSKYNNPQYKFKDNEDIYIFKKGLFTRTLLPINNNKQREILLKCTICTYNKIVKIKGFQSFNFVKHYRHKHPNIAYNIKSEKDLKLISNINNNKNNFFNTTIDSKKRLRANTIVDFDENIAYNKILNFIIDNNLPISLTNSNSFKELLSYYNKLNPIINSKKLKNLLNTTYNNKLEEFNLDLNKHFKSNGYYSLVFDAWTSNSQRSYIGIIISYITNTFNLKYKLIGFEELTESHTGLYQYNIITNLLSNINSINNNKDKLISITRDNASANTSTIQFFNNKYNNSTILDIHCIAHIINLVVQDILQDFILSTKQLNELINIHNNLDNIEEEENYTLITKVRKLITLLRYTQEGNKLLLEGINKYKLENIIPSNYNKVKIPLDSTTRWNSTYNMLKTFIELRLPIEYTIRLTNNNKIKDIILVNKDWDILIELTNIFEVFIKATIKLQGEFYTTLSYSLLYIYSIYKNLNKLKEKYINTRPHYADFYKLAIDKGINKLEKYFPSNLNINNINNIELEPYLLSIVLDPRFKLRHYKEGGLLYHYNNIENDIISILKDKYLKIKNSNIEEDIYNISDRENNSDNDLYLPNENTDEEYNIYITESTISRDIDPLEYWKLNYFKFPILSILARKYLAIPATSASVERVFSTSGNIINNKRNRLSSNIIKQLILLKNWKLNNIEDLESLYNNNEESSSDSDN